MIRKVIYLSIVLLLLVVVSCEKDFQDIGTNVIGNNVFNTNKDTVEISVEQSTDPIIIRTDNISIGDGGEYLLGIYNKPDYKKIEASIISQLAVLINPATDQDDVTVEFDSIYTLDKVFIKIPYVSTAIEDDADGRPQFLLDSVLGNTTVPTSLFIYRNGTYLNTLNPSNPSESNSFYSDEEYVELEMLNGKDESGVTVTSFIPKATDTMYFFNRATNTGGVYKDTITLSETSSAPFLTIPLNTSRMKELFWDKFDAAEFSTQDAFIDYFRGIIFKTEGSDGAMIPVTFSGTNAPTLDFYYTITTYDLSGVVQDTIPNKYSFPFSGVKTRKYKTTEAVNTPSSSSFAIQGTVGSMSEIELFDAAKLAELRAKNWLINDVSLTFYIDESKDTVDVPKKLFLYKKNENTSDSQVKDAYSEPSTFGGDLELSEAKVPEKYTFRITDYVSDLLDGTIDYNPSLMLKVYNVDTDAAISGFSLDTIVKTYNWNPRAVPLLNQLSTNGDKRAKLVISYSEEKDKN